MTRGYGMGKEGSRGAGVVVATTRAIENLARAKSGAIKTRKDCGIPHEEYPRHAFGRDYFAKKRPPHSTRAGPRVTHPRLSRRAIENLLRFLVRSKITIEI